MKKALTLTATLILCSTLTGCSNPLIKEPVEETARILTNASGSAMEKMGQVMSGMDERYLRCLENKEPTFFNCEQLYKTMTDVLAQQGIKVSVANLTDKALFKRLHEALQARTYFSR